MSFDQERKKQVAQQKEEERKGSLTINIDISVGNIFLWLPISLFFILFAGFTQNSFFFLIIHLLLFGGFVVARGVVCCAGSQQHSQTSDFT